MPLGRLEDGGEPDFARLCEGRAEEIAAAAIDLKRGVGQPVVAQAFVGLCVHGRVQRGGRWSDGLHGREEPRAHRARVDFRGSTSAKGARHEDVLVAEGPWEGVNLRGCVGCHDAWRRDSLREIKLDALHIAIGVADTIGLIARLSPIVHCFRC